ncbi:MAG: hypothetical protein IPG45_34020 [Deltaproteobacteria bacterium]|nr:hypothetical protein [Deltaproteobacteria bacterium]
MGERKRVRCGSITTSLALLLACSSCGPRAPVRAPVRVLLPFQTGKAMTTAVAAANAELPEGQRFALTGAHPTAGVVIERYTRADGLELVLFPDPSATGQVLELWWPIGWCSTPLDHQLVVPKDLPSLQAMDQLGARVNVEIGCERSVRRWWLPLGPRSLARALALEAEWSGRTGALEVHPRDRLQWSMAQAADRALLERTGAKTPDPKGPNRPALVFWTGPIDRQVGLQSVGAFGTGEPTSAPWSLPVGNVDRRLFVDSPASTLLRLSWRIEERDPLDRWALEAVGLVLTDGQESRLGRRLGGTSGSGLGAAVTSRVGPRAGALELEILVALENTATSSQAMTAIESELRAIGAGQTTGLELERARVALRQRHLSALASITGRGGKIAEVLFGAGELDHLELGLNYLDELPETALRQVVAQGIGASRPTVVLARPPPAPKVEVRPRP